MRDSGELRVLVTDGAGFLCSNLGDRLLAAVKLQPTLATRLRSVSATSLAVYAADAVGFGTNDLVTGRHWQAPGAADAGRSRLQSLSW